MPGAPSATDSGRRTAGSVFPNSARRQQATLDERAVPGCRIADFLFEELAEDEDLPGRPLGLAVDHGNLPAVRRVARQDRQQDWLRERRRCGDDTDCLSRAYAQRIDELDKQYAGIDKPL